MEATIRGSANHAGTTPMAMRRDALSAAAELIVAVRDVAERIGGAQVATVGAIQASPNLVNVIAREARLTIDLRNTDDAALARAEADVRAAANRIAKARGLTIDLRPTQRTRPVVFDPDVVGLVESVAGDLGLPVRRMTSGAGHDAQMMAAICPAGMIFVPSIGGISHNPREDTRAEDLEAGANALLHTMLRLALA
jgi:N-carbamoyl-L-amino-acid hydrolase